MTPHREHRGFRLRRTKDRSARTYDISTKEYLGETINPDVESASGDADNSARPRRSITRRTAQLPIMSKVLYRVDYYASMPIAAVSMLVSLVAMLLVGVVLKFPRAWETTFGVVASIVTLLMVFTIQHTQGREQSATQRKLDELLRAIPGAAESLMMLEEAPREFILEVEDSQRDARADLIEGLETVEDSEDVAPDEPRGQ